LLIERINEQNKKLNKGGFTQKQVQANAAKILETTCDLLVGAGYYVRFPAYSRALILENRYNPVKLIGSDDKTVAEIFRNSLSSTFISTTTGKQISLAEYFREGLMLIQYVEMMSRESTELPSDLVKAFEPYFAQTEYYRSAITELIHILRRLAIICSDWSDTILSYALDSLCAIKGITAPNQVTLTEHRPQLISIQLDGHKRELLRAGWADVLGGINWISIPPGKIGFESPGEENLPVYIQRHALNRLNERLGLHKGLIHESIAETLLAESSKWYRKNDKTMVPLEIFGKKLGYLLISTEQQKIIIRSFLFLTNNGTREGNQLSELTRLAPLDKQYLGMDTLRGFAGYNFSTDHQLAELLSAAGCGDLLQVTELLQFSEGPELRKNPQALMQYLKPYLVKQ